MQRISGETRGSRGGPISWTKYEKRKMGSRETIQSSWAQSEQSAISVEAWGATHTGAQAKALEQRAERARAKAAKAAKALEAEALEATALEKMAREHLARARVRDLLMDVGLAAGRIGRRIAPRVVNNVEKGRKERTCAIPLWPGRGRTGRSRIQVRCRFGVHPEGPQGIFLQSRACEEQRRWACEE